MKNEDLQEMRKEYIQDITLEVSKMGDKKIIKHLA